MNFRSFDALLDMHDKKKMVLKVALFIDFDKGRKANELIRNILEK